jgi:hypothetical protein
MVTCYLPDILIEFGERREESGLRSDKQKGIKELFSWNL